MRPILLVDIDGVIVVQALGRADEEFEYVLDPVDDDRVPMGMRDRFSRLEEVYECIWCTGREQDALQLARVLGFGTGWPVIRFAAGNARDRDWKLRQVRRWCRENAEGRKVAWIDDDAGPGVQAWADGREGTRIIWTGSTVGLTEEQTQELLDWAMG